MWISSTRESHPPYYGSYNAEGTFAFRVARVMHTVLCCRIIIHLRSAALKGNERISLAQILPTAKSGLQFRQDARVTSGDTTVGGTTVGASDQSDTIEMVEMGARDATNPTTSTLLVV